MSLVTVLAVSGCAARGNVDLLEAELRGQEDRLIELQSQLQSTRNELAATERETDSLRNQLAARGEKTFAPEQADAVFSAVGLRFRNLLTGTLDRDGKPGDDAVNVVIEPHDADGRTVKLPGAIRFDLVETDGLRPVGHWEFTAEETRERWRNGLVGEGFVFRLDWQAPPQNDRVLLQAEFTTADGRRFTATRELTVELAGEKRLSSVADPSVTDPFSPSQPE
jgi:hypothetical protein